MSLRENSWTLTAHGYYQSSQLSCLESPSPPEAFRSLILLSLADSYGRGTTEGGIDCPQDLEGAWIGLISCSRRRVLTRSTLVGRGFLRAGREVN